MRRVNVAESLSQAEAGRTSSDHILTSARTATSIDIWLTRVARAGGDRVALMNSRFGDDHAHCKRQFDVTTHKLEYSME